MSTMRNNDKIGSWVGLLIVAAGLALVFLPAMFGADMMAVGYGLGCAGVFVLLVGAVTAWLYGVRARIMDRIQAGEGILASWTYDDTQARQQIDKEFKRSRSQNLTIYLTMFVWFVLIGGVFAAIDYFGSGEVNGPFLASFFSVLLLLGVVAYFTPILWHRRAAKASRDVIISRDGLVMNGALHTWSSPFERLTSVKFREGPGEAALVFSIRFLSRIGLVDNATVTVPIPTSQREVAQQVVSSLSRKP